MRSLLAVVLVAASASAASAGTYLGLGIGTAASPGGDMTNATSDGNRSGRLLLGTTFGRLAIEGDGERFGMFRTIDYQGSMLAAVVKYSLPLGNNFEVYGRGGLQRTWLNRVSTAAGLPDFAGNGWLVGAGFEYRLNVAGTGVSLFVDYQHADTSLERQDAMQQPEDETIGLWTMGATVSI